MDGILRGAVARGLRACLTALFLCAASCGPVTAVQLDIEVGEGAPIPERLTVSVYGWSERLLAERTVPDEGPPDLPGSIVILLPDQTGRVRAVVTGWSGDAASSQGAAMADVTEGEVASTKVTLGPGLLLDRDRDGVPDEIDNCPLHANADQADEDGDGEGDVCDPDLLPPFCDEGSGLVLMVTVTDDEYDCLNGTGCTIDAAGGEADLSLREAIGIAEETAGPDTIRFDPAVFAPGAQTEILVGGATSTSDDMGPLLLEAGGTCIDGSGASVVLDASAMLEAGPVLQIRGPDNRIGYLTIVGARGGGIAIEGEAATGNTIAGCCIGNDGAEARPNAGDGICIEGGGSNTIGPGNVIGGNGMYGIDMVATTYNVIIGNLIGLSAGPAYAALPNVHGVHLADAEGNMVGGEEPWEANVIGLNDVSGVYLDGASFHNKVLGNFIGTDPWAALDLGNGTAEDLFHSDGIHLCEGPSLNQLGPWNTVRFSVGDGIQVNGVESAGNEITRNAISDNGELGIAITEAANRGIAPPVITSASASEIRGTAGAPDGSVVEVFVAAEDEGDTYLGATAVLSSAWLLEAAVPPGVYVTATVTAVDAGSSAFSTPYPTP